MGAPKPWRSAGRWMTPTERRLAVSTVSPTMAVLWPCRFWRRRTADNVGRFSSAIIRLHHRRRWLVRIPVDRVPTLIKSDHRVWDIRFLEQGDFVFGQPDANRGQRIVE